MKIALIAHDKKKNAIIDLAKVGTFSSGRMRTKLLSKGTTEGV